MDVSYDDGESYETIASGEATATSGTPVSWEVPLDRYAPAARIRIVVEDIFGRTGAFVSDSFEIINGDPPSLEILNPQAGDVWKTGETHQIRWRVTSVSPIGHISIDLIRPGATSELASHGFTLTEQNPTVTVEKTAWGRTVTFAVGWLGNIIIFSQIMGY